MKRKSLPQNIVVHDVSDMDLDNITEEIEKTIAAMDIFPPTPKSPPKKSELPSDWVG